MKRREVLLASVAMGLTANKPIKAASEQQSAEPFDTFRKKFQISSLLVQEFRYWSWSVRPVQSTLGAGILSLKRPVPDWADVSAQENAELSIAVGALEKRLRRRFAYDKINYLMLMMIDPYVHFHVLPRYSKDKSFQGQVWHDHGWPGAPDLGGTESPHNLLRDLQLELKR